uniref:Uncharacterized protein n=1 Tax=Pithovirus LCPAC202 TaxID=2506592 RepID=A0A481Z5T2_9VIRU|nr:MAG: hypothetical protein LCPAC202_01920 [Pithovirus LCPAC202]
MDDNISNQNSHSEEEDLSPEDVLLFKRWRQAVPMLLFDNWNALSVFLLQINNPKDRLKFLESTDDDGHDLTWWAVKYMAIRSHNLMREMKEKLTIVVDNDDEDPMTT